MNCPGHDKKLPALPTLKGFTMIVTRRSTLTGIRHEREIPADPADYNKWSLAGPNDPNRFVQHAMPYLSDDDREFLISGITPEEWEESFGDEEEEGRKEAMTFDAWLSNLEG